MTYFIISLAWTLSAGAALVLLIKRYRALKPLPPAAESGQWPSVTVIVPVRNEEDNIRDCLESLLAQDYPVDELRIRVVDDNSEDHTAEIVAVLAAEHPQLEILEAGALPAGWMGKPHACWVGSVGLQDEWLCFLDADTRTAPDLLRAAISTALAENLDVLSLHPEQQMLGFWERLLMPIPFMTLMLLMDAEAINDPRRKQAMANGQFILVRRTAYLAVGGHESIRGEVLEDVRLAEALKAAGYRLKLLGGGGFIKTHMYSQLKALWQGLARGGSELIGVPLTLLAVLTSGAAAVFPILYPVWIVLRVNREPQILPALLLACVGSALWYGAHGLELKRHHVPLGYLALIPLSMLFIAAVNLEGVLRRAAGKRLWKGRWI